MKRQTALVDKQRPLPHSPSATYPHYIMFYIRQGVSCITPARPIVRLEWEFFHTVDNVGGIATRSYAARTCSQSYEASYPAIPQRS